MGRLSTSPPGEHTVEGVSERHTRRRTEMTCSNTPHQPRHVSHRARDNRVLPEPLAERNRVCFSNPNDEQADLRRPPVARRFASAFVRLQAPAVDFVPQLLMPCLVLDGGERLRSWIPRGDVGPARGASLPQALIQQGSGLTDGG